MPADSQASDTARLDDSSIDSSSHGGGDLSDEATAEVRLRVEVRLRQESAQMRAPPSYTRGIRDVTSEFVAASQQLPRGELVKEEPFTLLEAVGALEIMDPKMDSGYIDEGDSFEPDFNPSAGLELEEVLWIMDELLCLEMAFHQGYPLSQNVFTSLHIFRLIDPETEYPYYLAFNDGQEGVNVELDTDENSIRQGLVHVVLEAYCVGLLKCVEMALQAIQSQTYYEDEDFVTYLFGRELLPQLTEEASRERLIYANNWIHERETILGEERAAILQSRIQSRISMLLGMASVEGYGNVKLSVLGFHGHDLARPLPEAFSHKVQRQLATNTPPRHQPTIAWSEACDLWARLCEDLLVISNVMTSELRRNPQSLLRAVWAFGYRNPQPNTYARAKMQEMLTLNEAVANDTRHHELLLTDIRQLVLPASETADPASFEIELPSDSRHKSSEIMNNFMNMVYGDWLNMYCIVCQNRCRMRRCFTQALAAWSKIVEAAPEYDRQLNKIRSHGFIRGNDGNRKHFKPLTYWSRHHQSQLMRWVIQLGFETDIYLPDEMLGMYRLLRNTIRPSADKHLSPLDRLHDKMLEDLRILSEPQTGRWNKQQLLTYQKECHDSVKYIEAILALQEVENVMARTVGWLFSMLENMKVIIAPTRTKMEAELRQEARLKPFLGLVAKDKADLLKTYVHCQEPYRSGDLPLDEGYIRKITTMIEINKKSILGTIGRLAKLAKDAKAIGTEGEWADNLDLLKRTTFDVGINTQRILQICQANGGIEFVNGKDYSEFIEMTLLPAELRQHCWWVVPQISEKKS